MDNERDIRPEIRETDKNVHQKRVDPHLLEILVCPLTKTSLKYDADNQELISKAAKLAFPIRQGIPIMLVEEARSISE